MPAKVGGMGDTYDVCSDEQPVSPGEPNQFPAPSATGGSAAAECAGEPGTCGADGAGQQSSRAADTGPAAAGSPASKRRCGKSGAGRAAPEEHTAKRAPDDAPSGKSNPISSAGEPGPERPATGKLQSGSAVSKPTKSIPAEPMEPKSGTEANAPQWTVESSAKSGAYESDAGK